MKKFTIGALGALFALTATAATATPAKGTHNPLEGLTEAQHVALIYTVNECGFEPSAALAVRLLKAPALATIAATLAQPTAPLPVLSASDCKALAEQH